jgi:putative glycosyltransferase (TIGR04348 family)
MLVALHACKSAGATLRFARDHPGRPIVIVLTGTDVYRDLPRSRRGMRAIELADAVVALQPLAIRRLPRRLQRKARVIRQSCRLEPNARASSRLREPGAAGRRTVRFAVLGHLRREKDPLRAAQALRRLPPDARICVVQAGGILDPAFAARVAREAEREPRYRYLGELSRARALALLARSDALILSSRLEGGANVATEAIALGVPVLASRIDGNLGVFGPDYAGYYAAGSTPELARLMQRFAQDPAFVQRLRAQIRALRPLFSPSKERAALGELVNELFT